MIKYKNLRKKKPKVRDCRQESSFIVSECHYRSQLEFCKAQGSLKSTCEGNVLTSSNSRGRPQLPSLPWKEGETCTQIRIPPAAAPRLNLCQTEPHQLRLSLGLQKTTRTPLSTLLHHHPPIPRSQPVSPALRWHMARVRGPGCSRHPWGARGLSCHQYLSHRTSLLSALPTRKGKALPRCPEGFLP